MDSPGLWKFLSEAFPLLLCVLFLLLLIDGHSLLDFLRGVYEARQDRLTAETNARVRLAELELEMERERNRSRRASAQAYQPYQEGLQELPPQQ